MAAHYATFGSSVVYTRDLVYVFFGYAVVLLKVFSETSAD